MKVESKSKNIENKEKENFIELVDATVAIINTNTEIDNQNLVFPDILFNYIPENYPSLTSRYFIG
jgi:hypothetical protein